MPKVRIHVHSFEGRNSMVIWLGGRPVLVAKDGGRFYGMDAVCAHMGCALLSEARGATAICPAHGAKYDMRTGQIVEPPQIKPEVPCEQEEIRVPLRTYGVTVGPDGLLNVSLS
jgi:nitrite reductase/ring-hydroxylating ferredoxin subunit